MNFKYVVAIVPPDAVKSLEAILRRIGVGGITLAKVKGFGEYKNFFTSDWLSEHTNIELFTEESKVEPTARRLARSRECRRPGAGIMAVIPVDRFPIFAPGPRPCLSRQLESSANRRTQRGSPLPETPPASKEKNMKGDSKMLVKMAVGLGVGLVVAYFALPAAQTFILISAPFLLAIFFVMKGINDNKKDESAKPGESKAESGVRNADQDEA